MTLVSFAALLAFPALAVDVVVTVPVPSGQSGVAGAGAGTGVDGGSGSAALSPVTLDVGLSAVTPAIAVSRIRAGTPAVAAAAAAPAMAAKRLAPADPVIHATAEYVRRLATAEPLRPLKVKGRESSGLSTVFDGRRLAADGQAPEPVPSEDGKAKAPLAKPAPAQDGKPSQPASAPATVPSAQPRPGVPWTVRAARAWKLVVAPFKAFTNKPTNDRDWSEDVAILPEARIDGDKVVIKNARNFEYRTTRDWTARYYDAEFDLNDLESVSYFVEPFGGAGQAHTFLSFGFKGDRYLSISVEIRRVKGDRFSPWRGLWNDFEITYVIGDERDLVRLRSNFRKDDVYLYPIRAPKEKVRELFLDMLGRANELRDKPEFYNTLTNTCTTNLLRHVNRIATKKLPWSYKVLLPGYSDRLVYDQGLIDTELSFEEARKKFRINDRAMKADASPDFSKLIRKLD